MGEKAIVVQRAIPLSSPEEWKEALSGIPHSFFHTWEHSYAMHLTHKLPAYLYCAESDGVRVVCPFIERPFGEYVDIATPYGFSGFAGNGELPELPENWDKFLRSRGYISAFLALHPLFFRGGYSRTKERDKLKALYFLNTALKTEQLLRKCSESRRRSIRRWRENEIEIVTERETLTRFAVDNYRDSLQRKNAGEAYDFSPATIQYLFSLQCVVVIGAAHAGKLEAVHLSAYSSQVAEYLFCFDLQGTESRSMGLIWEATERLRYLGVGNFNLGGGLADRDSLDEFKRRFGGERRFLQALKQVINPEIYTQLCARVGEEQRASRNYFPNYREPRI